MSSTTLPAPEGPTSPTISSRDHSDLAELGYEQQLHRKLGKFASFAAGFSFVSILTTIFQLFALGFSFGGPAFFFTWPLVFLGQFMVALNFAELAARYPISGAIYQWSRRMGGEIVGWFAGWFMIIAQIVTASAAAIALQVVLPSIWSGFQLVGDDPALTSPSGATNAVTNAPLGSDRRRRRRPRTSARPRLPEPLRAAAWRNPPPRPHRRRRPAR